MSSLADAGLEVGVSGNVIPMHKLDDSGDHKKFDTGADYISELNDYKEKIVANGIINGDKIVEAVSGSNNVVDSPKAVANLNSVEKVAIPLSLDLAITRAATNVAKISSVIITAAGAFDVVAGVDSLTSDFDLSGGRGGAGQPPYIPIDAIEAGQIRLADNVDAPIESYQIFQTIGSEREAAFKPAYEADVFTGEIVFKRALPTIHAGDTTKAVHASVSEVIFSEQENCDAFVPALPTSSSTSIPVYNGSLGSETRGFNASCTFTVQMKNGIDTDEITEVKDQIVMVRYSPDRNKSPYSLTHGRMNYALANSVSANPIGSVTIAAIEATREFSA